MFKEFIKRVINKLKTITKRIEEAYEETYPDFELVNQFNKEVERRKEENKQNLLMRLAIMVMKKCYEDTGHTPPFFVAQQMAEDMFEMGKEKGDINELNELVYEIED